MRAPVSWLREYVEGAPVATGREVAAALVRLGLEEEDLHGGDITGPLVVGRVLEFVEERQKNGKPIRWCQVDVGQHGQRVSEGTPQGIICGATNFAVGDLVVVVLPGAVLPGGPIGARKTYGHVSNGMICSAEELGLGAASADAEGAHGIVVLACCWVRRPRSS
jgi:phenylalanyl-tRNA synthetase beta chain